MNKTMWRVYSTQDDDVHFVNHWIEKYINMWEEQSTTTVLEVNSISHNNTLIVLLKIGFKNDN